MKLVIMLCFLHVTCVSAGLFSRHDLHPAHSDVSGSRTAHSTGSSKPGRTRPLFARRGQYERQRIHAKKPKVVPVAPNNIPPPSKVAPEPVTPACSQLKQSCMPQFGCCDKCATCHCRFFNAICFCRRIKS